MFSIYWYNLRWAPEKIFDSFDLALAFAKKHGFECNIIKEQEVLASWSPIGGLRVYR